MDSVTFKFSLGDLVKDSITPFKGTVESRIQWMNGCIRYSVQPNELNKDGKPVESVWIDEQQLVLVEEIKKEEKPQKARRQVGGERNDPSTFSR